MINLEHVVLASPEQMEFVREGMRNPMNSWEKSDSTFWGVGAGKTELGTWYEIGEHDHSLMQKLSDAGTEHRKYMRMIPVYVRITAPLYWWKEFDTYKIGTVANSCSTMHKIQEKEFTLEDFSTDQLYYVDQEMDDYIEATEGRNRLACVNPMHLMNEVVGTLNYYRKLWMSCDKALKANESYGANPEEQRKRIKVAQKKYWWQMIQLLPSSYNQTRNVMLNYEVLANIYRQRKNHKLDEWRDFCKWIESLPYSELITGDVKFPILDGEGAKVYDTREYAKEHPEWGEKIRGMAHEDNN